MDEVGLYRVLLRVINAENWPGTGVFRMSRVKAANSLGNYGISDQVQLVLAS